MSDRQITTVARQLIDAKKLIEKPENWCTHMRVNAANQRCLLGALEGNTYDLAVSGMGRFAERDLPEAVETLAKAIKEISPAKHYSNNNGYVIANFNNNEGHAAVIRALDLAISKALSVGR